MRIDTFQIARFRGIQSLALEGLSRVNMIVGANNAGKTAVLEALQTFCYPGHITRDDWLPMHRLTDRSVKEAIETWGWLWYQRNLEAPIELQALQGGLLDGKSIRRVMISVEDEPKGFRRQQYLQMESPWDIRFSISEDGKPAGNVPVKVHAKGGVHHFTAPHSLVPLGVLTTERATDVVKLAQHWGTLDETARQDQITALLNKADPRIKRIQVKALSAAAILQVDTGLNRYIPASFLGDGIQRLLRLSIGMAEAKGGVFLIDEMETGFHRSLLPTVWTFIKEAAKELDVQVFATTHSWEAIASAHEVFEKDSKDLVLFRLERDAENIKAVRIVNDQLARMVESGWEVR